MKSIFFVILVFFLTGCDPDFKNSEMYRDIKEFFSIEEADKEDNETPEEFHEIEQLRINYEKTHGKRNIK